METFNTILIAVPFFFFGVVNLIIAPIFIAYRNGLEDAYFYFTDEDNKYNPARCGAISLVASSVFFLLPNIISLILALVLIALFIFKLWIAEPNENVAS